MLLAMVAEEESRRPRDVSNLRGCLVGGDAAPLTLHQKYRDLFSVPLYESIGWRARHAAWANLSPAARPPLLITGRTRKLPPKLCAMAGYIPEIWSAKTKDGYLWFAGRLKQIIIRGGSNVAPQEVEEAIYQHPAVLETGVIGVPHPYIGPGGRGLRRSS